MRLPRIVVRWLRRKAAAIMERDPDWVIGGHENPYLERWWVIPRNKWFNIYLHVFRRSDDDRALHDHPWVNMSILIDGIYDEIVTGDYPRMRVDGDVVLRGACAQHRIELIDNDPVTTFFITGPKVREWGFQCPRGWRHWEDFVDPDDPQKVGPGCD